MRNKIVFRTKRLLSLAWPLDSGVLAHLAGDPVAEVVHAHVDAHVAAVADAVADDSEDLKASKAGGHWKRTRGAKLTRPRSKDRLPLDSTGRLPSRPVKTNSCERGPCGLS